MSNLALWQRYLYHYRLNARPPNMQVPLYHCHFEHGIWGRCDGCIEDALVVASLLESLHFHLQTLEENLSIKVDEVDSFSFLNNTHVFGS